MKRRFSDKELQDFVCRIDTKEKAQIARVFLSRLNGIPRHEYEALIRTIETIEFMNDWEG